MCIFSYNVSCNQSRANVHKTNHLNQASLQTANQAHCLCYKASKCFSISISNRYICFIRYTQYDKGIFMFSYNQIQYTNSIQILSANDIAHHRHCKSIQTKLLFRFVYTRECAFMRLFHQWRLRRNNRILCFLSISAQPVKCLPYFTF